MSLSTERATSSNSHQPILQRILSKRRGILERLYQLYRYDLSEYNKQDIGNDGTFGHVDLGPYIHDPKYLSQFILVDQAIAGFVLINTQSHVYEGQIMRNLDDFFVFRRYRRMGVASKAVFALFAALPGLWQINKKTYNDPAMRFWDRVVRDVTGGCYREYTMRGEIHIHIFQVPVAPAPSLRQQR